MDILPESGFKKKVHKGCDTKNIYLQIASICPVKLAKSDNSVSKAELSQQCSLVYPLNNSNSFSGLVKNSPTHWNVSSEK